MCPLDAAVETVPALRHANRARAPSETFDAATHEDFIATHLKAPGRTGGNALNWEHQFGG
jgi:hypothetical protein